MDSPDPPSSPLALTPPPRILSPTTDAESERRLASSLGYPPSWHVVRLVPHPAASCYLDRANRKSTCMDSIHAGNPLQKVDVYYNHNAALSACVEWLEGVSTGYESKGGQMLPRKATFKRGDRVEVNFEGEWFEAKIDKCRNYDDDTRYTVYYVEEDSTQANISEDLIRVLKKSKKGKKSKGKRARSEDDEAGAFLSPEADDNDTGEEVKKPTSSATRHANDEEEAKEVAEDMGLPEGWTARPRPGHRWYILCPDNKRSFRSKRQAFEHLGLPPPSSSSSSNKKRKTNRQNTDGTDQAQPHPSSGEEGVASKPSPPQEELDLAQTLGLPVGWTAKHRSNKSYYIISSDGKKKYRSAKAALEDLGMSPPAATTPGKKKTPKKNQPITTDHFSSSTADAAPARKEEEQGDPPWRRVDHAFLNRKCRYNTGDDIQIGVVTGWLDANDVDSKGEAAFLSEKTGDPARLFHVNFIEGDVVFMDFEEWELKEILID